MTVQQAKEMDMVEYLFTLGHEPSRISGRSYWYLSPLHEEKTASFKVNRQMNRWYDFAEGKGGNLVDFGMLFYKCSVRDFLGKLNGLGQPEYRPQKAEIDNTARQEDQNQIQILSVFEITSFPLVKYLGNRKISNGIADKYLKEVRYKTGERTYYALGFKNDSGGYELRSENFKGSSSPKDITFLNNGAPELAVFEGFFNFLSYKEMYYKQQEPHRNFLILNSTSFFEKSIPKMQEHSLVHLFLDNDKSGEKCTLKALDLAPQTFRDQRHLYHKHDDLNDWLVHIGLSQKHQLRQKL